MTSRWAIVLIAVTVLGADAKRPITETDLYAFQWAGNPQISPDGSKIVYTLVKVTAKHDNYETALWITPANGGPARQLTAGPHDSNAQWSPDGKLLAFLRATEKDGKPEPPQIYLLPMEGGEARPLTEIPKGAGEAGVVAGWAVDRVQLFDASQGFRKEEGRCAARERRARDHSRGISRERRRLLGFRAAGSYLDRGCSASSGGIAEGAASDRRAILARGTSRGRATEERFTSRRIARRSIIMSRRRTRSMMSARPGARFAK